MEKAGAVLENPGPHYCLYERRWGKLEAELAIFISRVTGHVDEGEKQGGFRDRLKDVEAASKGLADQISTIKKGYWKVGLSCGFIGALIGKLTPDAVVVLSRVLRHLIGL